MFGSLSKLLDLQFFVEQAKQSQAVANLVMQTGKEGLSWADIACNLSIIATLLSQTFGFIFKALGWIGGWGLFLLLLSFIFLSFLNFLSPFKRANYLLVVIFISLYAYWSAVPSNSVLKFILLMLAPALLTAILHLFFTLVRKISREKKKTCIRSKPEVARCHISLARLRKARRRTTRLSCREFNR